MAEVGKKKVTKKSVTRKDAHKKGDQPDVAGHVTKKGGVTKRGEQPDVQGHVVARNHSRKSDDPSIHAR